MSIGVSVVGRALQPSVALVGALRLGPRHDVIDVAPLGWDVATGRVPAVPVAHLDGPPQHTREGPLARHRHDRVRAVEEDRLEHGRVDEPDERVGRHDPPGGQLAEPGQRLVADERGEERLRSLRPGRCGRRSRGHLDERGGTPLAGGAHDAVTVVAEAELVGEPAELVEHDAATDRIERGVDDDGAIDRLGRLRRRRVDRAVGGGCAAVGVGVLLPVGDDALGVREAQPLAVADQRGFVVGEPLGRRVPGAAEQIDVVRRQGAGAYGGDRARQR